MHIPLTANTQPTRSKYRSASMHGFTLVELMITVAIIAILASIALPAYQDSISKSRRADAQGALLGLANAMERHFTSSNSFLGAAGTSGSPTNTGSPWVFPNTSPIDGGTTAYNLTISAAATSSYTLTATPTGPQAGNGVMTLDNTGARRWDEGNDGFGSSDNDWRVN